MRAERRFDGLGDELCGFAVMSAGPMAVDPERGVDVGVPYAVCAFKVKFGRRPDELDVD
ncbi:MAG: hypothetical protein ACRDSE_10965 [Pseudonocardiaceae bacterium]